MSSLAPRPVCIYALCEPCYASTEGEIPPPNVVRYVGKTINPSLRFWCHTKAYTNSHRDRWVRTLRSAGTKPLFVIVEILTDGDDWQEAERGWISRYRAEGAALTNHTIGGDGIIDPSGVLETKRIKAIRKRGLSKLNLSGFKGISWVSAGGKWRAACRIEGKTKNLGAFDSPEDAALAYDCAVRHLYGDEVYLNFPARTDYPFTFEQLTRPRLQASPFRGISYATRRNQWDASLVYRDESKRYRTLHIGCFADEISAARGYDAVARQILGEAAKLNFPDDPPIAVPRKRIGRCGYRGVERASTAVLYGATVRHKGRRFYLGAYETAEEAARAYDAKAREIYGDRARLNFPD